MVHPLEHGMRRAILALAGAAGFGCGIGEGFVDFGQDVFEPDSLTYDAPGRKIADGSFSGMLVDPWGEDGAVIVAFRYLPDGPHLRMQPFDGSRGCDVGIAQRCIVFNKLDQKQQLVAVVSHTDASGRGTLNFVNHDCEVVYGGIERAQIPARLFEEPPGYLVDAETQLLEIDPWAGETRVLSPALQRWSGSVSEDAQLWFVEDGQFVALDRNRQELGRVGEAVTEILGVAPGLSNFHLVEAGRLMKYPALDSAPELIAEDLCEVSIGTTGYSFMSPCASRRLVVQDSNTGGTEVVDEGVSRVLVLSRSASVADDGTAVEALYIKPSATVPGVQNIWLKKAGQPPVLFRENLVRFLSGSIGAEPRVTGLFDPNGPVATLLTTNGTEDEVVHGAIASNYSLVDQGDFYYAMVEPTATDGTLAAVAKDGEVTEVASGVPFDSTLLAPVVDPDIDGVTDPGYFEKSALLYDVTEGLGTLGLLTRADPGSLIELGRGVQPSRFEFFQRTPALGYISGFDRETRIGTLHVYNTELGIRSDITERAVEFTELMWPFDGVLYTVRDGEDESIWAARAK